MVNAPFDNPIPIVVRRMRLDFSDVEERFFYDDNPVFSSILAAISATFPPGEAAFIRSVRGCLDAVTDETLLEQVRQFSTQEGHHAHQHKALNAALDRLGYDVTGASKAFDALIDIRSEGRTDLEHLAGTVAMEHLTASMAHFVLENPQRFDPLPESMKTLFFWHAIEEIEHKAVAFDVFVAAGGSRNLLRVALLVQLPRFAKDVNRMRRKMLDDMGVRPTWRDRVKTARWLFGRKGMVPGVAGHVLSLLKSGFHPWDVDDRELVDAWKERLA